MNPKVDLTTVTFTEVVTNDDGTTEDVTVTYTSSPFYAAVSDEVNEVSHPSATGQSAVPTAPAMQRFTDEEMMDCPEEQCLTAQWDAGDAIPGSFESSLGTHYFYTEPITYDGEPGNKTVQIKKFSRRRSQTVAEAEHLTIVTLLDEGIGSRAKWCKVRVQDLDRSTAFYNVEGYVERSHLRRLKYGELCWQGPTTLPSPKAAKHKRRKKTTWSLGSPWYEMLACEPWLDEKELKFMTTVNTGHKDRELMDMLEDQAKRIGVKQLCVYYDRLPSGYDVHTLDNGVAHLRNDLYKFAKLEKTFLSDRPDDSIKALISVNYSHLIAVPRMVRSFTTATQVRTGHRTVMYQSDTITKKLKKVGNTMENLQSSVDLFPGIVKGSQSYSPKKWGKMIKTFVPALKKLFKANGYDLRKDHEDIIEIGTDADFNPTHVIVYPDDTGMGMPQTIGFNSFAAQLPANSARLMHYILQGNNMFSDAKKPEMTTLTPPWMTYLTQYTYPPLEIRPTPPSGLNVPKLADMANIANQMNALPIKGPKDLKFENLKLKDPKFLADMAAARFDVAIPAGDNIVANIPIVLDKISSLDDVYAELLQKISIPKLIEQAMAKLMAELGLDNIYAALLEAALGQFSIDALIKQFMLQLPEDLLADLLQQLLDMLDVSCDDLIQLMVDMGISTNHLQGIADQIGDEISALQDQIDSFNDMIPGMCPDSEEAELETDMEEVADDAAENIADSLDNILANLTCDDLKLIIQKIATIGVPSFDFEPPTVDLSCFVKDIELAMGAALMPFMLPLTGAPLDITRLGEIDWSGLVPEAPNIQIMTPDGEFINILDWDTDAADLSELPGFSMPTGGFNPAAASPNLNYPQFALGGTDASTGDATASPGGLQFPNVKFAEQFSDLEMPGGVETLIEAIGGLAEGAIPGISTEDLGPEGGASLSDVSDVRFGELLDDWRRVFVETFSGFLLSNFVFAMAGGGKPFNALKTKMEGMAWGSEGATMDIPEGSDTAIPNSTLPNIPEWNASGVQTPAGTCTLDTSVTETTGLGWQTLATMPREWWASSVDGSGVDSVVSLPDFESLKAQRDALGTTARVQTIELYDALTALAEFDFSAGFDPCALFQAADALSVCLEEFDLDPETGDYYIDGDVFCNIADIKLPTAVFRPEVGCGTYQLYGIPDFGLGNMSLPIPIAGPNGDETFDIFDLEALLGKLPEVPNFPDVLPEVPATDVGLDVSILCDKPDLFAVLGDLMVGNIPDVPAALGGFDAVIKNMEMMGEGAPGTAQGIPAKQIAIALFKFIIDKLGFKPMLSQLVEILIQFMDADLLTVEMIQEIPAIQTKIDALSIPGADGLPSFSPGALKGMGSNGSSPSIESASSMLPGAGMPSGAPGGGDTSGGAIASMGGSFKLPTITLPDDIPTGDLMGAMFSGMAGAVKQAIESAIVEMGKSVLRSLLDGASDGNFGDFDMMDALSDAYGAAAAEDLVCDIFSNVGVDCGGNLTDSTLLSTTTISIEMGCDEPIEIDPEDPETGPVTAACPPATFVSAVSSKLSQQESALLLQGVVGPKMCARIEDVMRGECPHYALVFDDCQKIADTFEAIGDFIPKKVIEKIETPVVPVLKDLRKICCEEPLREKIQARTAKGMPEEEAALDAAEEVKQQIEDLGNLANMLMGLPEGFPFAGDGHGDTIVPDVWPCEDNCDIEADDPPKPSLFPPDDEIPTLNFMNQMATDLMYEPVKLAFKMESDLYPEMLISGTVHNVAIPFYDPAGTHESGGEEGINRYAEQLFNAGHQLVDSSGELFDGSEYKKILKKVRKTLSAEEDDFGARFKKAHVLQQHNSGSVVPVLYQSLRTYDYVSNEWDTDTQTYAWYFQYGGNEETPTGDEWPTVVWKMDPITDAELATGGPGRFVPASSTTSVPASTETPQGQPCDPYSASVTEEIEQPESVELETGIPLKYQLFRQFIRDKFTKHPMLLEGVDVASLSSWTALGLDSDGTALAAGFGFPGMYKQVINQIIQSAGVQIIFTEFFSADRLKILEIEPTSFSPATKCGDPPRSVLDLDDSAKNPTKDAFAKACKDPAKEKETGKNAFKQAGLVGVCEITIRVYVVDMLLRSIFPISEYDVGSFDSIFLKQVADKITTEMQMLDPQYHDAFMDTLDKVFKAACDAAVCKGEPLTDPMTGEELDCESMSALMYYIKKHLVDVADILDEKFGTSTPSLSKVAQESWLTTLPIPEYPIPDDMDITGLGSQADLFATLLNNPRPEMNLDGMTTYYVGDIAATTESTTESTDETTTTEESSVYIEADITSLNSGELIDPMWPDNLPLPRLFSFSETDYSTEDLAFVAEEVYLLDPAEMSEAGITDAELASKETVTLAASWQQISDPVEAFLEEGGQHNNLYYSLLDNWHRPQHAAYPIPSMFPMTTDVKGGLYLEKYIKIGQEYWHPDNLQQWFDLLIDRCTDRPIDSTAFAALAQYATAEAEYGLRLCYMLPTRTPSLTGGAGSTVAANVDLFTLLGEMFGHSAGLMPDVSKMQGSLLQPEAVIFNAEVAAEVLSEAEDKSHHDEESAPTMVTATAIESHQEKFFNVSIPLVESSISAGSPISIAMATGGATRDAAGEFLEAGVLPASADIEAFNTPWTDASTALDEKLTALQVKMRRSSEWKYIFTQLLCSNDIVQQLWNYCSMMTTTSVPKIDLAFAQTKQELRILFWTLYNDIGTGGDGFSFQAETETTDMEVATLNQDTDGGGLPLPIKMALNTIPMLFKGIAEAIDPNIMIAKLIRIAADGDQGKIAKFPSTLMALPFNLIPPPPFGPGIGPPITPIGLAYLALGALTPMEKQGLRMNDANNPPPPPGTGGGDGSDADCNSNEDEADE